MSSQYAAIIQTIGISRCSRRRGRTHKLWKDNSEEWTGQSLSSLLHIADDRAFEIISQTAIVLTELVLNSVYILKRTFSSKLATGWLDLVRVIKNTNKSNRSGWFLCSLVERQRPQPQTKLEQTNQNNNAPRDQRPLRNKRRLARGVANPSISSSNFCFINIWPSPSRKLYEISASQIAYGMSCAVSTRWRPVASLPHNLPKFGQHLLWGHEPKVEAAHKTASIKY